MANADKDYTIAERYTLPSHGLVYEGDVNPDIKIRSMTVRDEMRRQAPPNDGTIYRVLAEVIDDCLVDKPGISSYDMCIGDFQFLMHKLRVVTYGPEYNISCRCSGCGNHDDYVVSLDDLSIDELKEFDREKYLKVELPISKKVVELNFNTPRTLDNIEKDVDRVKKQYKKQHKEASDVDWHLLYQLIYAVKTVDGQKLSITQKENFCNNLVGRDYNTIINAVDKLDRKVGLGLMFEVTCSDCGLNMSVPFRLTSEFFRPTPAYKGPGDR